MATNNVINAPLPLSVANGGTGQASLTAHGILVGEGSSNVNPIVLSAGQILVGTTSGDPANTTLTAGSGIVINSSSGSITISTTSAGFAWSTVTGTTQTLAAENGYIANNASLVTFTLPTTAAVGDTFQIIGLGAGGWKIAQNASQLIRFGSSVTTTGVGGSLASSNQYDSVTCVCTVANTTFAITYAVGNLTVV